MTLGRIARLVPDRDFGFVAAEGKEYFFHANELQGAAFEELAEGTPVEFEASGDMSEDRRAEGPRAMNVRIAE